jgi:hypothetical protein
LHNPRAQELAEDIAVTIGDHRPTIDEYLWMLGYAPIAHIDALRRRGALIAFAPTIAHFLASSEADRRRLARGYPTLSLNERACIVREFGAESSAVAVYDPATDALVLPFLRPGPDKLRALLHELGHAVTHHRLAGQEADYSHVLGLLPRRIQRHLECGYPADVAIRVREAFAEAHAMLVCGRVAELGVMASELIGILNAMETTPRSEQGFRWKVDLASGRSATLAAPEDVSSLEPIPDVDDPLPVRPVAVARDVVQVIRGACAQVSGRRVR